MTTMTTKFDLAANPAEPSTGAAVTEVSNIDNIMLYAKDSIELFAKADTDDEMLYIDLRQVVYARVGDSSDESLISFATLLNHRFTREQAEMLLTVLTHEFSKL